MILYMQDESYGCINTIDELPCRVTTRGTKGLVPLAISMRIAFRV